MNPASALAGNEVRILRHDPLPGVLIVGMPLVLMTLLTPALRIALRVEGHPEATGAEQTVPGMACVFGFFIVAVVGFGLFREHGWKTWPRLRALGIAPVSLLAGKLAVPAALLVVQQLVLFTFGALALDLKAGSWLGVGVVSLAYSATILSFGLAAAAVLDTVQQLNAVTNLAAMVAGGLGGAFVPVSTLPGWVQPIAPISPTYWAMKGYERAIFGGSAQGIVAAVAVLGGFALAAALLTTRRLRLDDSKRTWG